MTPIGELRAGIPFGLLVGLPPLAVYLTAIIGNMAPVIFLIYFLPWFEKKALEPYSRKAIVHHPYSSMALKLYLWYREKIKRKNIKKFKKWGAVALIPFVAIPLPMTGAITGALAAYIFGIRPKKALPMIFSGVLIAGLIVTLITLGIV